MVLVVLIFLWAIQTLFLMFVLQIKTKLSLLKPIQHALQGVWHGL